MPIVSVNDLRKRKRTQSDRNHDAYRRMREAISSVYRSARTSYYTHEQILERMGWIWDSDVWKKMPKYYRDMAREHQQTLADQLQERDLVWRLGPATGPIPESVDGWAMDANKNSILGVLARMPGALFGAHFWKGTDKPFSTYHATNGNEPHKVTE